MSNSHTHERNSFTCNRTFSMKASSIAECVRQRAMRAWKLITTLDRSSTPNFEARAWFRMHQPKRAFETLAKAIHCSPTHPPVVYPFLSETFKGSAFNQLSIRGFKSVSNSCIDLRRAVLLIPERAGSSFKKIVINSKLDGAIPSPNKCITVSMKSSGDRMSVQAAGK